MFYRLAGAGALLVVAFLLLACADEAGLPTPANGEQVQVAHVVDGDTVVLDDGRRVRYIGINTPEQGQPYYAAATQANRRLVEGKDAWLVLDTQPTDRHGRVLGYLWVGGQLVNQELVRQGYANAYTEPPNVRYSAELAAAEQEARAAEVGLWTPAGALVSIQNIVYDAPGPDHENPNGEWIELVNRGSEAIDLTGFTLKDGANHIYAFSTVELEPNQVLRLYSGQGHDSAVDLYWGIAGDSVWNNKGDIAYLRDPQGRLVDSYAY
jgi:endonuclease YncB( thermonuclease family)